MGVAFDGVDVTLANENSAIRSYIIDELGYLEAPVMVINDDDHRPSFRPDHIALPPVA